MKTLNTIRKIILFPLRILIYPFKLIFVVPLDFIIGFFLTNWEDEWDRDYYFKTIKKNLKF